MEAECIFFNESIGILTLGNGLVFGERTGIGRPVIFANRPPVTAHRTGAMN
jgi:hypothetical protein